MPNLREYVTVGICGGYGDGDYRVSMAVADLSREEFTQLRLAMVYAIYAMEEIWRKEREKEAPVQTGTGSDNA